jgi:hypothetical protein
MRRQVPIFHKTSWLHICLSRQQSCCGSGTCPLVACFQKYVPTLAGLPSEMSSSSSVATADCVCFRLVALPLASWAGSSCAFFKRFSPTAGGLPAACGWQYQNGREADRHITVCNDAHGAEMVAGAQLGSALDLPWALLGLPLLLPPCCHCSCLLANRWHCLRHLLTMAPAWAPPLLLKRLACRRMRRCPAALCPTWRKA